MRFIIDPTVPIDKLAHDHFKFLGRWIHFSLSEVKVMNFVKATFNAEVLLIERCGVNGLMKLWLYQHSLGPPRVAIPYLQLSTLVRRGTG
jgi:hypothetical protein